MNRHRGNLPSLLVVAILLSACGARMGASGPVGHPAPSASSPGSLLGKSIHERQIARFISSSGCSASGRFELCPRIGMALWVNAAQLIAAVYLYVNVAGVVSPYAGRLPFGLRFYDTLGAVEHKLKTLETHEELEAVWNAGLPDKGSSPDRFHYWAMYERYGMTIIYNAPYPDEDATIYAIVLDRFFLLSCRRPRIADYCGL